MYLFFIMKTVQLDDDFKERNENEKLLNDIKVRDSITRSVTIKRFILAFVFCFTVLILGATTTQVAKEYYFNQVLIKQMTQEFDIDLKRAECENLSNQFPLLPSEYDQYPDSIDYTPMIDGYSNQ